MKISTKSRHAINAMVDLALRGPENPTPLSYMCESQDVSLSYLEQLFAKLREKGLVRGIRGPGGGYLLARDRDEISIGEIIFAVEEQVEHIPREILARGTDDQYYTSSDLWDDLSQQMFDFLSGISLGDLVGRSETLADGVEVGALRPATLDATKQAA